MEEDKCAAVVVDTGAEEAAAAVADHHQDVEGLHRGTTAIAVLVDRAVVPALRRGSAEHRADRVPTLRASFECH